MSDVKVTPFDTSQVNLVLKAIVDEKPTGYRYVNPDGKECRPDDESSCFYSDREGKGSCLVGKVAERFGIPLPTYDAAANVMGISASIHFAPYFTAQAIDRLSTVQSRQDAGETWRRAIR